MRRTFSAIAMLLLSSAFLFGCAAQQTRMAPMTFSPAPFESGKYQPRVNNALFILDSSMTMAMEGSGTNFQNAKGVIAGINRSLPPDLGFNTGLRHFGLHSKQLAAETELIYGLARYSRSGLQQGLDAVKEAGGNSPLAAALMAAGQDLSGAGGKNAIVVVSDGLQMSDAPVAARKLVDAVGGNLCIHTIAVGGFPQGEKALQQVAAASSCGSSQTAASLADSGAMAAFVEKAFLQRKAAPVDGDDDGDGVPNSRDKCPNTPRGEFVDEDGCSLKLTLHINFDFDKAEIQPEFKADLDRAATFIREHSQVPFILIAGHTDHTGSADYNQKLSEDRARAVRDYLVANYGIDGKRLLFRGYGKSRPVADNKTREGRYQNRRVEIICCVLPPE